MRDWGWFIIIQKTRACIGLPNPQEELEQLEAKAGATWGKYDEQLKTKDRLLEENVTIKEETKALMAQLEKEQGNLSVYHDKQAKATSAIAGLEVDLANAQLSRRILRMLRWQSQRSSRRRPTATTQSAA